MRALRVPDCARTERARPTRDTAAHRAQSQESARRSHRQSGADGKAKTETSERRHGIEMSTHTNYMHEGSRHQYMLGGVQYVESEKQLEYMTSETHTLSSQTDTRCQTHRRDTAPRPRRYRARDSQREKYDTYTKPGSRSFRAPPHPCAAATKPCAVPSVQSKVASRHAHTQNHPL